MSLKLLICSKIGIDTRRSMVKLCYKYDISGQLLAFSIEDDDAIDAMWEHSKATSIPSLELYVEVVPEQHTNASYYRRRHKRTS